MIWLKSPKCCVLSVWCLQQEGLSPTSERRLYHVLSVCVFIKKVYLQSLRGNCTMSHMCGVFSKRYYLQPLRDECAMFHVCDVFSKRDYLQPLRGSQGQQQYPILF